MNEDSISPNALAEYYDGIFMVLDHLPSDSHPVWEFALESVLFGGEGLNDEAIPYGEQQAERNDFTIGEYRERYGNGDRVTDFPAIEEGIPRVEDREYLDGLCIPPKSPKSGRVLPVFVGEDDLTEAMSILAEFPAEPQAEEPGEGINRLLDPSRFPGLSGDVTEVGEGSSDTVSSESTGDDIEDVSPNEVADLYEIFRLLADAIPDESHPHWKNAILSIIYDGEFLDDEGIAYGEQQATRNEFKMDSYRERYGNGDRVTEFPTLDTETVSVDTISGEEVRVPIAPESGVALPVLVNENDLRDALQLLTEFPPEPSADSEPDGLEHLIDGDQISSIGIDRLENVTDGSAETTATTDRDLTEKSETVDNAGVIDDDGGDSTPEPRSASKIEGSDSDGNVTGHGEDPIQSEKDRSQETQHTTAESINGPERNSEQPATQSDTSVSGSPGNEAAKTDSKSGDGQSADDDSVNDEAETTVLREENVGEANQVNIGEDSTESPSSVLDDLNDEERKHDDPRAEYAHRKAQQRDRLMSSNSVRR